ncbi:MULTISPECIES: tryptophan transporter [Bacillales]|uniref:Tryptophan transporter n=1 Tax=Lysinibacillus louembei TaxID=1470088 RepID=A0ABZ0S3K4_9BACI|nr:MULTISPECIES: tryptophan transporter [Bacillales]MCT6924658.1 tryptophan transporter [Metasolibacillus sp.]MCT6940860.1 tryptophan transporter [Metasolibacillus sp.]WPK13883.1 tryptophan transporter [Lysinibacillus louembei]
MNTKNLVLMALLVGVGATLYVIIPGINGGMKPDFMLTMMFIGILLFPTFKETFLLALSTGVLSGLFSTFPGGFVPNIIDKAVTGFLFLIIVLALRQLVQKLAVTISLVAIGTIVSGSTFLAMALLLTDVPIKFSVLFLTVVLPAVVLNTIAFVIIFPIVSKLLKRSSFKTAVSHA